VGRSPADARVVEGNVDAAELRYRLPHQVLHAAAVGHVAGNEGTFGTPGLNVLERRLTVLLRYIGNYYLGAPFREGEGRGFPIPDEAPVISTTLSLKSI
jgi:hypothetical protein